MRSEKSSSTTFDNISKTGPVRLCAVPRICTAGAIRTCICAGIIDICCSQWSTAPLPRRMIFLSIWWLIATALRYRFSMRSLTRTHRSHPPQSVSSVRLPKPTSHSLHSSCASSAGSAPPLYAGSLPNFGAKAALSTAPTATPYPPPRTNHPFPFPTPL